MKNGNFDIQDYCLRLREALLAAFGEKLCYMGLQGSYLRGEATENSDIDIMVILDTLTTEDMDQYRAILKQLGDHDRACGFFCSRQDMKHWNPLEICHLTHTTADLYGRLEEFIPAWTMEDEKNFIKMSLNNLYHALCHGYIHGSMENRGANLLPLYKSAFFILQNTHFLETWQTLGRGSFIASKAELLEYLQGEDQQVLETLLQLTKGTLPNPKEQVPLLLHWCQNKMSQF